MKGFSKKISMISLLISVVILGVAFQGCTKDELHPEIVGVWKLADEEPVGDYLDWLHKLGVHPEEDKLAVYMIIFEGGVYRSLFMWHLQYDFENDKPQDNPLYLRIYDTNVGTWYWDEKDGYIHFYDEEVNYIWDQVWAWWDEDRPAHYDGGPQRFKVDVLNADSFSFRIYAGSRSVQRRFYRCSQEEYECDMERARIIMEMKMGHV